MRLFAALAIPPGVSSGIMDAFSRARSLAPRVKWVAPEGMHLTLHFFGDIPDAAVEGFNPVFQDSTLRRAPIVARLGQVGFFPPSGKPKVLWAGLSEGVEEMRAFWSRFTERLSPLQRPGGPLARWSSDSRGFSPHITVARSGAAPLDPVLGEGVGLPAEEFRISECILYQSILGSGPARYLAMKRILFEDSAA